MRGIAHTGVAVAVLTILAGCSTSVPGSVMMTTVPAPAATVDLAQLDPGNYPTKPRPPLGAAGANGGFVEAARMGANVIGPWQVDPALTSSPAPDAERPERFASFFSRPTTEAAQNHGLLAVFTTHRSHAANDPSLVNAVMRFASPEDAAAAATDMTAASTKTDDFGYVSIYDPIPIPRYPATSGLTYFWDRLGKWTVQAFTAHGPYVLAQYADSKVGAEAAAELVAATLDRQVPAIDQFQPTPVDQLKNLPLDPDGLLARTLPPDNGNGFVYAPLTQLHFDSDPAGSQQLFTDAHVQSVAKGRVNVYQTPDAASAQRIVDGFATAVLKNGIGESPFTSAASAHGLPDSKCLIHKTTMEFELSTTYCLVTADRYAIEVSAAQERDAHQQMSAQYLMLTGK